MKYNHVKPYLFVLLFLLMPLLLIPLIKTVLNKSDFMKEEVLSPSSAQSFNQAQKYGLVIHGGAGNFNANDISAAMEISYKKALLDAIQVGIVALEDSVPATEVVEQVIHVLENSPLFNAGKGAVFAHNGKNELDASIMDGKTLNAGAVAGITVVKNPISAAKRVLDSSSHVLLSGVGAEAFSKEQGLELVDPSYFYTEKRWKLLEKTLEKKGQSKMGTVGCVVLDQYGNLAAGTSTGGMNNKKYGRIGDSPIIGAGTYANNSSCAISSTGHGEYFIRHAVAYDISARMLYLGEPLDEAAMHVIEKLKNIQGSGGVIGIDKHGNITMSFNTTGMFRGFYLSNEEPQVFLYKN